MDAGCPVHPLLGAVPAMGLDPYPRPLLYEGGGGGVRLDALGAALSAAAARRGVLGLALCSLTQDLFEGPDVALAAMLEKDVLDSNIGVQ